MPTIFSRVVKALSYNSASYAGDTDARREVSVLTGDTEPLMYTIEPHTELAYSSHPPMKAIEGNAIGTTCEGKRHQQENMALGHSLSAKSSVVYHKRVEITKPHFQPRIADREWLPGSTFPGHSLPQYLACPRENRPAVYEAASSNYPIEKWAETARVIIDERLHNYGTILFRSLPLRNADDFSRFVKALGYQSASRAGSNGSRHEVSDLVLTASDNDPPIYTIEPHNEMAYSSNPPVKVLFYCDHPATPGHGGESVVGDVRDILPKLNKEVVDKFERLGVRYYSYVGCKKRNDSHLSWQETFQTDDKTEVVTYLEDNGFEYRWEVNDSLFYWYNRPVFQTHPLTGERVWYNQITIHHASYFFNHPNFVDLDIPNWQYPYHSGYGDGSEIEPEVIRHIRDVLWQTAVGFQMQKSDVLVYDNMYAQHARIGYTCNRKLLVALTNE
ncbi:dapdiamide synthesis protein DdaC-like [Glandiceps talaboti]